VFFQRPPQEKAAPLPQPERDGEIPEQVNTRTPEQANARTGEHLNMRTPERPHARTRERTISRESYNVFKDQHEELLRIEMEGRMSGKAVFKSEMVREALDDYLRKKGRRTPERVNT
jgi:hypothetical protein